MATAFAYTKRPRRPSIAYPDLGPWAGVLFLLCAVFMIAARFEYPAPHVQLPACSNVCTPTIKHLLITYVDASNRIYIAASDTKLQTAIIQQVAQYHHVRFSAAQLHELYKIPFLSQDIQRLPTWLSAPRAQRAKFPLGIPIAPNDDQVSEYIKASISASYALYGEPIAFAIRADERLTFLQVKQVIDMFQKQGINRINLITNLKE